MKGNWSDISRAPKETLMLAGKAPPSGIAGATKVEGKMREAGAPRVEESEADYDFRIRCQGTL